MLKLNTDFCYHNCFQLLEKLEDSFSPALTEPKLHKTRELFRITRLMKPGEDSRGGKCCPKEIHIASCVEVEVDLSVLDDVRNRKPIIVNGDSLHFLTPAITGVPGDKGPHAVYTREDRSAEAIITFSRSQKNLIRLSYKPDSHSFSLEKCGLSGNTYVLVDMDQSAFVDHFDDFLPMPDKIQG